MTVGRRRFLKTGAAYGQHLAAFDWDFAIAEKDYENGLKVFIPLAVETPIPYAKAVEPSFLRKAQAKYTS